MKRIKQSEPQICYLCGKTLLGGDINRDHVPPKQFYPSEILSNFNLNLLTLPVHKNCNSSYKHDEDYFCASMACTTDSLTGKSKMKDLRRTFNSQPGQRLAIKVYGEFKDQIGHIVLPDGVGAKQFDGARIWRIIWKITRGLYLHEFKKILPDNTPKKFISFDYNKVPDGVDPLLNQPEHGEFPSVFAYKYLVSERFDGFNFWAFLFWNRLICTLGFEHPDCQCDKCKEAKGEIKIKD
jgi:hypothetical protein